MSGGPTAYRLIGSGVTALCFVVIFRRVFARTLWPWTALQFLNSPTCCDQVVCLCLGDVIQEVRVVCMDKGGWLVWTRVSKV